MEGKLTRGALLGILWLLIIAVCSDFPLLLSQSWCSPPFWDSAPATQRSSMLPRTAPRVHLRSLPLPVSLARDASHVCSGTPATSRSVLFIFSNNQLPACGLRCGLCLTVSSLLPSLAALGLLRWLLCFQLLKAGWLRVPRLRRGARSCVPPSGHRLCCAPVSVCCFLILVPYQVFSNLPCNFFFD